MAFLHSEVSDLLNKYTLQSYNDFPDNKWWDIETDLELKQYDPKIALFYLRQAGLLDDAGKWQEELIEYGLVLPVNYREADQATGFSQAVKKVLVGERGSSFFSEIFDLILP
jgi:hypothetical protein